MTYATITGIGSYLPARVLTNDELSQMVDTNDEWIVSRTGIRERRLAEPDETTSTMAAAAGASAIADAGLTAADIDFLVVGTGSPDHIMPSTAALTQDLLGLKCGAVDVMAACTSFITALHHGASLIEAGRASRVLVIGSDALTRHIDFTDRRTCVLFGDGAGAVVLEVSEEAGVLGIDIGADGSGAGVLTIPAGGSAAPCTAERVEAGEHFLKMSGGDVFKFAVRVIPDTTRRALELSGLAVDDLTWLVPHQANQRILDAVAPRLGIDPARVFSNVELLGNTSAASIPLALHDLYTGGHLHRGDVLALVGFGAGLTWGAAVVRWTKGPIE